MVFFSVLDLDLGSALPKKTCVFSAQPAHWIVADFWEKQLISAIKNIPKKASLFQEIKKHFSTYFFPACFFRQLTFLINFSKNLSNVFSISSPSLTFPYFQCFFF